MPQRGDKARSLQQMTLLPQNMAKIRFYIGIGTIFGAPFRLALVLPSPALMTMETVSSGSAGCKYCNQHQSTCEYLLRVILMHCANALMRIIPLSFTAVALWWRCTPIVLVDREAVNIGTNHFPERPRALSYMSIRNILSVCSR